MKLYAFPTSPFVRKVRVLLHETGHLGEVEVTETVVTPVAPSDALLSKNPLSKIPALERADGVTLYDSRVICAYLDDLYGAKLYGTGAGRWDMLTLEATADGMMEAALSMTYEARMRPEDKQWPDWVEGQWSKVARACAALDAKWMSHLEGPLNIGQIGVGCALAYLDFRHGARDWRRDSPALATWFAKFDSRDSMVATRPPAG